VVFRSVGGISLKGILKSWPPCVPLFCSLPHSEVSSFVLSVTPHDDVVTSCVLLQAQKQQAGASKTESQNKTFPFISQPSQIFVIVMES
jgi:hypothetical protein